MRTLRYLLAWYFFILCILTAAPGIAFGLSLLKIGDPLLLKISVAMEIAIIVVALVFGRAWWVLWHENLSARAWCTTASLTSLIAPVGLSTLTLMGPKFPHFWQGVAIYTILIAIGVGGVVFAFSDAARPLPSGLQPHLGRVIVDSVLLLHIGCLFVSALVMCAIEFAKHRHILATHLLVVALLGCGLWALFWSLRRTMRNRRAERNDIPLHLGIRAE